MARKGENIYKRKDGRWEGRYVKGCYEDGRAKYAYVYAHSYQETRRLLGEAKIKQALGESIVGRSPKIAEIANEWLEINRHKVSESTFVKYSAVIKKHIISELGALRAECVTEGHICTFTDTLLCEKQLAPKTVRDILTILGSILKYARHKNGAKMPSAEIIYPKYNRKEMRVLSVAEQRRLFEFLTTDTDRRKLGIMLALITGMRIGELCALRWGDISFEDRCVRVRATMQRLLDADSGVTRVVISSPKTENSARIIPLTEFALGLCEHFRAEDKRAFVLTGDAERFCEPRVMQYHFDKITQDLGLLGVHFHSLRHTFATRCVEVGFEIKSLSEILGHASPKITLERYVHSSIELKRDNMQKLCALGF
ncbi:MAG: site-specific integrase [Ruminococcaceae bacterium]|nr:site-specific integrase [Oscillospiraceae bacterium]